MAATRSKATPPVGSSQWIQNEKEHADQFVTQEVEEFSYSVRNELEWLNEHMADIFSKTQVNFADMFKTPGKLRGKTPRTARKRDATAPRQPLTDIFAPNATLPAPASAQKTSFYDRVAQLQVPQDENQMPTHKPVSRGTSPQRAGKPWTDSGYHGMMTEDEMELDAATHAETDTSSRAGEPQKIPTRDDQPLAQRLRDGKADETGTSDDSFISAREQESDTPAAADEEIEDAAPAGEPQDEPHAEDEVMQDENVPPPTEEEEEEAHEAPANEDMKALEAEQDNDVDMNVDESPHSDASSPQKPLHRKSSFTFSSLPAREPLGAKRSMGQVDRHRSSFFGKSINKASQNDADDELSQEKSADARVHNKSSTQLLHERLNMLGKTKEPRSSKSIPQSVLVNQPTYPQLPETEQSNSQATEAYDYPEKVAGKTPAPMDDDDDDDWIAPAKPHSASQKESTDSPSRPAMHQKSISTNYIPSPKPEMAPDTRHQKAISISHPNFAEALDTNTPAGSPMTKRNNDGPISASKNRLWSALKSAKSIFASSASASAAAKLEAHNISPAPANSPRRISGESKMFNMPGALYTQKDLLQHPARNNSVISFSPSRKTRKSAESDKQREKELKAQQKADEELEKAREKERQRAAKCLAEEKAKAEKAEKAEAAKQEKERKQAEKQKALTPAQRPISAESEKAPESDMGPPPPPKNSVLSSGKLKAPGRLIRPTRNEPAQSKPAPVSIRVASQSQRLGQGATQSSFSKSQGAGAVPPPPPKDAGPRASSAIGFRPGSAAPGNSRVKALEAAARKKEADERAAAKKAEQKRELERKRAEKAEQEKRAEEERKAAEQQRVQEAKQVAQRKAAEKQAADARKREQDRAEQQRREQERQEQARREQERAEQQRREAEQWRQQDEARKAREAHEFAEQIRRERAQQAQTQAHGRSDVPGTLRQLTKNMVPSINPAKPAKRQLPADDDEPAQQPQRPGLVRGPATYQQTDAKRRRTNEEQEEPNERRSVMAPPKRPSTLRKVCEVPSNTCRNTHTSKETMTKFSHGYTHAPPPAAHHASMFKATVTAQHQMQHGSKPAHPSQLVQMSNARIPFAENANPQATYQPSGSQSQMHPGYENVPPNKFKTPARPAHAPKSAKSTPHYPQGDNIELPDIATDSEDESDDEEETGGGFRAPSWVASPALRDLLTQQQLVDPETVFGPIGELKMDEVFKNSKNQDRLKRFRDRGSSALWTETGDAVTSAEKKKDMEMREKVAREGGWRYEPNA
ncbi:C-type lectin [Lecanosticta acicola]|uniref:C-type lectin n=1 Tax=Lecanosticta acicola TaxID=111012 RepID=A0AAI9EDP2_9PEZI|nr:C-type lectin [Lecanosticta acicola]